MYFINANFYRHDVLTKNRFTWGLQDAVCPLLLYQLTQDKSHQCVWAFNEPGGTYIYIYVYIYIHLSNIYSASFQVLSHLFTRQGFEGERCTVAAWRELEIRLWKRWWMTTKRWRIKPFWGIMEQTVWAYPIFRMMGFPNTIFRRIYYKWWFSRLFSGFAGSVRYTLPRCGLTGSM